MACGDFIIKDSGERLVLSSGMQRDTTEGKVDYSLCLDGPMFDRLAVHLTKGAVKYDKRNWMKATPDDGSAERFRESALRHFLQWFRGDADEDHAAAVFFNINGYEYVKAQPAPNPGTITLTSGTAAAACECAGCQMYHAAICSAQGDGDAG